MSSKRQRSLKEGEEKERPATNFIYEKEKMRSADLWEYRKLEQSRHKDQGGAREEEKKKKE